jgi:hypothetical protein
MRWGDLATAVYARLEGDTASGGLRFADAPLVNAIWLYGQGGEAPEVPYVSLQFVSDTADEVFEADRAAFSVVFQVDLYTVRDEGDVGHIAAAKRIETLLRRWAPSGVSGYNTFQIFTDNITALFPEDSLLRSTWECRCGMSLSGA